MSDMLSQKQFNTERSMIEQGNLDELSTRVRGVQQMTSNVFRPSFSQDLTTVRRQPSGTAVAGAARPTGQTVEEGEDEE